MRHNQLALGFVALDCSGKGRLFSANRKQGQTGAHAPARFRSTAADSTSGSTGSGGRQSPAWYVEAKRRGQLLSAAMLRITPRSESVEMTVVMPIRAACRTSDGMAKHASEGAGSDTCRCVAPAAPPGWTCPCRWCHRAAV